MSKNSAPLVHVILGPTAVGKTDLAISLAQKNDGAVVSADSRQIYAGMNIGTAKPAAAFRHEAHDIFQADIVDGVPHYLLNVASPTDPWTLAHWQEAAHRVIDELVSKNTPVFVVGGTMLYIDSLLFHYDIPDVAPQLELRAAMEKEPVDVLYTRLLLADPAAQEFIEPHHKQRIIRALEVIEVSGKPFSVSRIRRESPYQFEVTGLFPIEAFSDEGWDMLRNRITQRVTAMVDAGLQEETIQLTTRYSPELPLLHTMNYAQMAKLITGDLSREQAEAEMVSVNVRYARRQMSWWRKRQDITWKIV